MDLGLPALQLNMFLPMAQYSSVKPLHDSIKNTHTNSVYVYSITLFLQNFESLILMQQYYKTHFYPNVRHLTWNVAYQTRHSNPNTPYNINYTAVWN